MRAQITIATLAALSILLIGAAGQPGSWDGPRTQTPPASFRPEKGVVGLHLYVITLSEPPLALYKGGIADLARTAIDDEKGAVNRRSRRKLATQSPAALAYRRYLDARQTEFLQKAARGLGRALVPTHRYAIALNGLTLRLTQREAGYIARMPSVKAVTRDIAGNLDTDRGPMLIGAPGLWSGSAAGQLGVQGEGMLIGILDSGINLNAGGGPAHPSFAEIGADGYVHINPLGAGNFLGECNDFPGMCNNKVIGCYAFLAAWENVDSFTPPGDPTCKDTNGHGSHVAAIAAGNVVMDAPLFDVDGNDAGLILGPISGVAPHANIISYKVCAPSCFPSDRVDAIEQAILDGVDALNQSIGIPNGSPWNLASIVTQAFRAARAAGIMVHVSAGNTGPEPGTAGRSTNAPWVTSAGNSTHDRAFPLKMLRGLSGGDTLPPPDMEGRGVTAGFSGEMVWAGHVVAGSPGEPNFEMPEQCLEPFPAGTFTANQIVLCDRGEIARVQKGRNVRDGGAGAFILGNVPGGNDSLDNDAHVIPAIHIRADAADSLREWLSSGTGHMGTITGIGAPVIEPNNADMIRESSARGPYAGFDFIVPSVVAPGVAIYAAGAGLQFDHPGLETPEPEDDPVVQTLFGIISGTSMASPHVAGAAILLKQLHPGWTAAEIQSALMTTGMTGMRKSDGVTPADPFDFGGGRIQVDRAANAGLILHETDAGFDAAHPALGGDPGNLNHAALVREACRQRCGWERIVQATRTGTWVASANAQNGVTLIVSPERFTLADGETQTLTITAEMNGAPTETWSFGDVVLTPEGGSGDGIETPPTVFSVALRLAGSVLPESLSLMVNRDRGSQVVEGLISAYEITELAVNAHGLGRAQPFALSIGRDSRILSPFDDLTDGVHVEFFTVTAGAERFVAEAFSAEARNIDLYVGVDVNGDGQPSEDEVLCASLAPLANEFCDVDLAGEAPEQSWWVLVHNWLSSTNPPDAVTLAVTHVPGANLGNFDVTGPARVPAFEPFSIEVFWDAGMVEGDIFYGVIRLAASPAGPQIGRIPVRLERVADE